MSKLIFVLFASIFLFANSSYGPFEEFKDQVLIDNNPFASLDMTPAIGKSRSIGRAGSGCITGAVPLIAEPRDNFVVSNQETRNFFWAHPETIANLRAIAEKSRGFCKLVFREAGFEVKGATSGRQALRIISEEMPDVILLDVMMPGMDGIEVCRRIREQDTRGPRIIMYTADDRDVTKASSLKAGANYFLTKRIPIFELPDKINGFLSLGTGQLPQHSMVSA